MRFSPIFITKYKKYFVTCLLLCSVIFPSVAHAEIFYILPRLGLNVTLFQDRRIAYSGSSTSIQDSTNATFALSLAAGIHFSRIPLRLELDLTFRTPSLTDLTERDVSIQAKTYQLTTMANVYYDIYIPNINLVPYVGVGVGFTSFFTDTKANFNNSVLYSTNGLANVDFSWNIIVGLSYPISSFLLDASVRFVDSGRPKLVRSPLSSRARIMGFDFLIGFRFPL